MADPFLGEIKMVPYNYAQRGWAFCNGQFLPIAQNTALFSLLGPTYGGNGVTTFALPDLRGRVPIHFGDGFTQGQVGGQTAHTLTQSEMPAHTHLANATNANATLNSPAGNILAQATTTIYGSPQDPTLLNPATITSVGGSQAHNNLMPYLVVNFVIALQGIFPSRN